MLVVVVFSFNFADMPKSLIFKYPLSVSNRLSGFKGDKKMKAIKRPYYCPSTINQQICGYSGCGFGIFSDLHVPVNNVVLVEVLKGEQEVPSVKFAGLFW